MTGRWVLVSALVAVTTVTACARPVAPGAGPSGWPAGRTFLSTSVTEGGAPKLLIAGTRIELRFAENGQVSANAGCNHMGGSGRLRDGALVLTDLSMTEMGCPGGRHEQDGWVADFLTGSPRMELSGDDLTLSNATVTILLTDRHVIDPDRPLTGTRWVVDTIFTGGAASSVPPNGPAVLVIDSAGTYVVSTGCVGGEVRGRTSIVAGQVDFEVTEEVSCTGSSNGLDQAVRNFLAGELSYEIEARRLRLLQPNGDGLGLVAAA
jgi:heat shock protein HslJ